MYMRSAVLDELFSRKKLTILHIPEDKTGWEGGTETASNTEPEREREKSKGDEITSLVFVLFKCADVTISSSKKVIESSLL